MTRNWCNREKCQHCAPGLHEEILKIENGAIYQKVATNNTKLYKVELLQYDQENKTSD